MEELIESRPLRLSRDGLTEEENLTKACYLGGARVSRRFGSYGLEFRDGGLG